MDRRKFSLSLMSTAVLAGCGGGGGAPLEEAAPAPVPIPEVPLGPELASPTSLPPSTVFAQTGTLTDPDRNAPAPGQTNRFDLNGNFSLGDGGNDQFDDVLELSVTVGATTFDFPWDQTYAELTAHGPELGAADGVLGAFITTDAGFKINGNASAVLPIGPDSRLQQTLNLGPAAGHGLDLTWTGNVNAGWWNIDEPFHFQVVVRDTGGNLLTTLYRQDRSGTSGTWGTASMSAYAGQTVVLSFEQRSSSWRASVIDDVSVFDATDNREYVVNGDFENGNTGWTMPVARVAQNIASGVRTVASVGSVQRHFFTQPDAMWGRMTDVITNTSGSDATATITYSNNLGSDDAGIIYATPGATTKALTTWDGASSDRDIGFVFGAATSVNFVTATGINTWDGSDDITWTFDVTVPAGGSITLVHFVILSGADTGQANDINARATEVDTLAADIANNFRTKFAYQRGMTQAQLDTLVNF